MEGTYNRILVVYTYPLSLIAIFYIHKVELVRPLCSKRILWSRLSVDWQMQIEPSVYGPRFYQTLDHQDC